MKLINRYGLPDAFFRAVKADPYSRGLSDYSATSLANPPRAAVLIEAFKDTLEIDISTRVAATLGQGTHSILERAQRPGIDIVERRYYANFNVDDKDYIVSAQIDIYEGDTGCLQDWKTTKAFAFHKRSGNGKKPEWIWQMNVAVEIMRRQEVEINVKSLKVIGLLKDWERRKAKEEPGYPPFEIMTVELPLWESEETVAYINERIRLHEAAKVKLPKCTSTETWGGNRCAQWCDAASVCEQYKQTKSTGIIE